MKNLPPIITEPLTATPHLMIVEAPFYQDIAEKLWAGAQAVLDEAGASYERIQVPGAMEIPAAITYGVRMKQFSPARRRFDGYVALGCVIKGESFHFDIVAQESARALMNLAGRYALALSNGIITAYTHDQAVERADPQRGNMGGRATATCLSMLGLKQKFGLFPRK